MGLIRQVLRVNRCDDQPLVRFPHLPHETLDVGTRFRRGLPGAKGRLLQLKRMLTLAE